MFWLILVAEMTFFFQKMWVWILVQTPTPQHQAMSHDLKLPGLHDQVKLIQDMGFPSDSSFKIQWVDDVFSKYQSASSCRIKCVCWKTMQAMQSIGGYIEDTLILGSCYTTRFLQMFWGKKQLWNLWLSRLLWRRCVWDGHVQIRLRVWIQHQWIWCVCQLVICVMLFAVNLAHVRKSCRLVCPGCSLYVLHKMLVSSCLWDFWSQNSLRISMFHHAFWCNNATCMFRVHIGTSSPPAPVGRCSTCVDGLCLATWQKVEDGPFRGSFLFTKLGSCPLNHDWRRNCTSLMKGIVWVMSWCDFGWKHS